MGTLNLADETPKLKRKGKTLLEKMGALVGADRSHRLPADASARYKRLINAKHRLVTTPEDFEWRKEIPGTIERPAALEGRVLYARP